MNPTTPIDASTNQLTFAERTGRLVLVITVLGVLGIGYSKVLLFIFYNFTDKIYIPHFINYEHIIATCLLSSAFLILACAIWYCYCEFSALNYIKRNDREALRNINRADLAYGYVFKLSSLYFTLSVLSVVLYTVILSFVVRNYLFIGYALTIVFIFLVSLLFKRCRNKIYKDLSLLKNYIITNWGKLVVWIVTSIFIFLNLFIAMGYNQKTVFTVKFPNEATVPVKLNFENSVPEIVTIKFYSVDDGNNGQLTKEIEVKKSHFRRSFVEVTEKPEPSNKTSLISFLDNQIKKGKQAYISRKSFYEYNFEINARDHLKHGKNFVVIQFNIGSFANKEYYKIVNQIDLDDKGVVLINKNEFQGK